MRHRLYLTIAAWLLVLPPPAVHASSQQLVEVDDFSTISQTLAGVSLPLLLVFTADDCPYCDQLADEILLPMIRSGEYQARVVIRALNLDGGPVRDFDGQPIEPWEFAQRYDVTVTPTMVLLDDRGRTLGESLVGVRSLDFYEAMISKAIERAAKRLSLPSTH